MRKRGRGVGGERERESVCEKERKREGCRGLQGEEKGNKVELTPLHTELIFCFLGTHGETGEGTEREREREKRERERQGREQRERERERDRGGNRERERE